MRKKLSISMDETVIAKIKQVVDGKVFRSTSHFIEYAVDEFLKQK